MQILDLLRSDGYITVNKSLAHSIGLEETIVLSELASRYIWHQQRGELEDDWFYCTVETLEKQTTLSKYKQTQAINRLNELGLLANEVRGIPAKRYFKLHLSAIQKLFDNKKSKNLTTSEQKTEQLEGKKLNGSKTKNKTKLNKNIYTGDNFTAFKKIYEQEMGTVSRNYTTSERQKLVELINDFSVETVLESYRYFLKHISDFTDRAGDEGVDWFHKQYNKVQQRMNGTSQRSDLTPAQIRARES